MEHFELFTGVLAVLLAAAAYLGWYQRGAVKEIDREGKILAACEAVHEVLAPIAVGTANKYDDVLDALLMAAIKLLKDKEGLENLSEVEKEKMKEFFLAKVKK